jgi:hypothetical protein
VPDGLGLRHDDHRRFGELKSVVDRDQLLLAVEQAQLMVEEVGGATIRLET